MATRPERSRWSYADFARLPSDDGNRYEVIAGVLHVTPSPRSLHQLIAVRLGQLLNGFAEDHRLGWVFGPVDVLFAEGDYLAPDLVFIRRDRREIISDRGIEAAPDLVIEILSDSTARRDRGLKRERYALYGVAEYWVVDPDARTIDVHRLKDRAAHPITASDAFDWRPVPGGPALTIPAPEVLRGFE
ncbi:MAG TPA: Uma2 family endonuclease [Longimicrobiales bacterium]